MLLYSNNKRLSQHCVSTLTSRNTNVTLFVVFSSLNTVFRPFSDILTCKYMNQAYPVSVYTLNRRSTSYCFFSNVKNVLLTIHAVLCLSKHHPYLFSNFQTSKYVRRYLVSCRVYLSCCAFVFKNINRTSSVASKLSNIWGRRTLIHAFLLPKWSCLHGLLDIKLQKHHSYLECSFLTTVDFIYCLF